MRHRTVVYTLAPLTALVLAATGCSSGSSGAYGKTSSGGSSTTGASASPAGATGAAVTTVKTATSSLGSIVVDGDGQTLYLFTPDTGPTSTCTGGCATAWPPLTGPATAGDGVTGALGVTTRSDGTQQVTLDGHPLYRYASDNAPGDTNGEGSGGKWYVLDGSGTAITKAKTSSGGGY
jgi:predicted lipoprotein with Yx(FWY)xxD motif